MSERINSKPSVHYERQETPKVYTLGAAAKATGKSKATISKALKSGRISGYKGDDGVFHIDPSELHRVYPPISLDEHEETPDSEPESISTKMLVRELEMRLEAAQQRLTDKDGVIDDLREDRDRWRQQATSLLEDKRHKSFFKRIFER